MESSKFLVKMVVRAAEAEASSANASVEAIKASGDAAAELLKTAALEVVLLMCYCRNLLELSYHLKEYVVLELVVSCRCLSLVAKMKETEVPLILDIQVDGSRFVLEAKTIQKIEWVVLTILKRRMQVVTPFSFIDDFLRKVIGGQPTSKSMILRLNKLILCLIDDNFDVFLYSSHRLEGKKSLHEEMRVKSVNSQCR